MVIEYVVEKWGMSALQAALMDLGNDVPINDALAKHTEPIEKLDESFAAVSIRRRIELQLQQQLDVLEQKLNQLQPSNPGADAKALSREQQAELLHFQQEKLATRKSLRNVQHQLNADIDALGLRLKAINLLAMPLLVILVAIVIAWRRWARRRISVR